MQVVDRAVFHSDNCYNIPNFHVTGRLCKTNMPSCTAFRGFGGPQAIFIIENIVDRIVTFLNASPIKVGLGLTCLRHYLAILRMPEANQSTYLKNKCV